MTYSPVSRLASHNAAVCWLKVNKFLHLWIYLPPTAFSQPCILDFQDFCPYYPFLKILVYLAVRCFTLYVLPYPACRTTWNAWLMHLNQGLKCLHKKKIFKNAPSILIFSYFRAEHRKHNYPIIWHIANIVLGRLFDTLFICLHWNISFRIMQIFANHTLSRWFL